ncbi:hypothetical protein L195_g002904 [Trifolium pratense]|uniref:Uncharacterized protein n=1 Tax=Trifolium pratense TaxID=57577 RepID=A0A2K3NTS1_TRIPR|nr:hypothetical protein L195_g002904 [Trifolium pratense]
MLLFSKPNLSSEHDGHHGFKLWTVVTEAVAVTVIADVVVEVVATCITAVAM